MIRFIIDSTADFTAEEAETLGITIVPLMVNFGANQYRDGIDLSAEDFFEMLAKAETLPTTSQPSPDVFLQHFNAARDAGDSVICITIAGALSGTYQSAQIAKAESGYDDIHIVDSCSATLAEGMLLRRALVRRDEGLSAEEIVIDLEEARSHLYLFAVVDTLTYLRKGGRLSSAAAFAGGLLGIKPVVTLDLEGNVSLAGKARGLPGAYVSIFKMIEATGGIDEKWPVIVGYTGNRASAEPFVRYVSQNLHLQKPLINAIGTVIGTHAGPGARGIAFFSK